MENNWPHTFQTRRRQRFDNWIFSDDHSCSADKTAEARFTFIGDETSPDAVKCFLCEKVLEDWDPQDGPWSEQIRHSPNCSFAKLRMPQYLLILRDLIDIKELTKKTIIKDFITLNDKSIFHLKMSLNSLCIQTVFLE